MKRRVLLVSLLAAGLICASPQTENVPAQIIGAFGATRAPSIAVNQKDHLYLAMSVATSVTGGPHSQIFFAVSVDGGVNWDNLPRTRNLSSSPGEAFGPSLAITKVGGIRAYLTYHDNSNGITQAYLARSKKKAKFREPENITRGAVGAFDPRVALDSTEAVNIVWGDTTGGRRRVVFVRSADLGATFSTAFDVSRSAGLAFDPEIAIDDLDAINVVWDDTAAGIGAIMFSRSIDGGLSFSQPLQVSTGDNNSTAAHIAIGSTGAIHVVWVETISAENQVMYSRSTDQGATFSKPINLTNTPGADIRKPLLAVFGEKVYVTYHDDNPDSHQVFLVKSENSGERFSAPAQVSDASRRRGQGHSPSMAFDSRGRLHVVWIDSSILGNDEGILFYSRSEDGTRFTPQRMILAAL